METHDRSGVVVAVSDNPTDNGIPQHEVLVAVPNDADDVGLDGDKSDNEDESDKAKELGIHGEELVPEGHSLGVHYVLGDVREVAEVTDHG